MVEPCETRPTGQAAQIWNHASLVLILIICAFSVVRGAHAFVVLRALSGSDRGDTKLVWGLQLCSILVGILTSAASLMAHFALGLHRVNSWYYAFFGCEFAMFFVYDAWLIFRDRNLQCHFFRTPPFHLGIVCFFVFLALIDLAFFFSQSNTTKLLTQSQIALYGLQYFLQLVILVGMTYLFTRPLLSMTAALPRAEGSDDDRESSVSGPGSVMRSVVYRTAVGGGLHLATSLLYVISLTLWSLGYMCYVARGIMFHLGALGFVVHLGISHRDDVALRLAASHAASVLTKNVCPAWLWFWWRGHLQDEDGDSATNPLPANARPSERSGFAAAFSIEEEEWRDLRASGGGGDDWRGSRADNNGLAKGNGKQDPRKDAGDVTVELGHVY